jgi:hypothetical protein
VLQDHRESQVLQVIAGSFSGTLLTGTPSYYDVLFPSNFINNYTVYFESDVSRIWTVTNKTPTGFRANSNSSSPVFSTVYWEAEDLTVGSIGIVVGLQGSQGPQGSGTGGGGVGATGPQGPPGEYIIYNIDGGNSLSTYSPTSNIDGGTSSTEF